MSGLVRGRKAVVRKASRRCRRTSAGIFCPTHQSYAHGKIYVRKICCWSNVLAKAKRRKRPRWGGAKPDRSPAACGGAETRAQTPVVAPPLRAQPLPPKPIPASLRFTVPFASKRGFPKVDLPLPRVAKAKAGIPMNVPQLTGRNGGVRDALCDAVRSGRRVGKARPS
jgi:hypothetical protein